MFAWEESRHWRRSDEIWRTNLGSERKEREIRFVIFYLDRRKLLPALSDYHRSEGVALELAMLPWAKASPSKTVTFIDAEVCA